MLFFNVGLAINKIFYFNGEWKLLSDLNKLSSIFLKKEKNKKPKNHTKNEKTRHQNIYICNIGKDVSCTNN